MSDEARGTDGGYWGRLTEQKEKIVDVRREAARHQTVAGRAIERVGAILAHPLFFLGALLLHGLWVVLNIPDLSPVRPWDPPPFTLLAAIASVEAPLLALLILMRQQQDARIAELREDTSLQTSLHSEREISKLLEMVQRVHEALGVEDEGAAELERMKQPLDPDRLVDAIEAEKEEEGESP